MTVHRRVAGADHRRSDVGQSLQQGRAVQDLERVIAAHLIADRGKPLAARLEFGLGKAQEEAAGLPGLDIDAGFALKSRRQRRPLPGGFPGPAGIVGNAAALAVNPDQAEVPA